ncbi:phosphotransferase [Nocardioides bizhenqiangii]|uniref:Phosphotransferase n=1 Tax=Nocardioides bizhenqiangii TaxID=3095076 RepID=A0ABZ0ZU44_9ACTN|nr:MULTISPECIES: phosphotransferase [unclassified Nocardioides]MDZ5623595.1 phosphotransferase [Nocardioides sp. HM23]WQQ27819.1 phosphotransferase [Nocardioides sp. HM61]
MDAARWTEPRFLESARQWIDEQLAGHGLAVTGDIEQPHVMKWSTVLRVPTADGAVWFKANDQSLRHEAGITALLAERHPANVPPLLAADLDRGWMLMADAGRRLREVLPEDGSVDRWLGVLRSVAEIQIACEDSVDELLALGVPDLRLATLPDTYDRQAREFDVEPRFRAATPYVRELCDRLAAFGIRETLQHDDLHDGQVYVKDGTHLVMDWGDACVSHPFFTLSVTLEGQISWGLDDVEDSVDLAPFRDAYLAPYAAAYPDLTRDDLLDAVDAALRLGWACRFANGMVPGEDPGPRLRMFLDGRA